MLVFNNNNNMKNYIKNYIVRVPLLLVFLLLFSCKKSFLEVVPPGRLVAETTSEYSALLSSANLILFGTAGAGYEAPIRMADDVSGLQPLFSGASLKAQRQFRWEADIYQPDENPSELNFLAQLYVVNKIINEVSQSTGGTEAEKASILAEAKANRAFYYFMIMNLFAKPYDPATAASDPGFPIITQADVTQTNFPSRASVKEVYDFMISDLLAAMPDLPTTIPFGGRMSRPAAQGLLGKIYVFMGNYTGALPLLDLCINNIGSVGTSVALYDYNTAMVDGTFPNDPLFGISFPLINNNREALLWRATNNLYAGYFGPDFSEEITGGELVLSQKARALFLPSDLRLNFFTNSFFFSPPLPGGHIRRGFGTAQTVWLNLADMYLLRAECKARANDRNGAVTDVQYLRARRMPASDVPVPNAIAGIQNDLIRFIIDERVREFACTGFTRWFDMRRLSVDPIFQNDTYTHIVYPESGLPTGSTSFTLSKQRLTMRIPAKILGQNPGMQDNP
jgi:hypothetical protein